MKAPSERQLAQVASDLRKLAPGAQKAVGDGIYMRLDKNGRPASSTVCARPTPAPASPAAPTTPGRPLTTPAAAVRPPRPRRSSESPPAETRSASWRSTSTRRRSGGPTAPTALRESPPRWSGWVRRSISGQSTCRISQYSKQARGPELRRCSAGGQTDVMPSFIKGASYRSIWSSRSLLSGSSRL